MWEPMLKSYEDMKKTTLHWSYRDLREFPEDLKNLDQIVEELYLKENYISAIPKWFLCNIQLKFIHLAGNCIKCIPEEISLLHNLEFLDLFENCLEELPKSIWRLERLRELNVGGNRIHYVTADIGRLKNLEILNLSKNQIRSLPPEIGRCVNLNELILCDNEFLHSIPEIIASLPNLKVFCADRCGLLYLPSCLSKSVKYLKIFNNNLLTHIPEPYWEFFERYYEVPIYFSNSWIKTPPFCFTIRERKTNRFLSLTPRTKKVLCCIRDRQHVYSLFEHCLRFIHKWSIKGVQLDANCLPANLKDYIKNGPIAKCLNHHCKTLLFCEYFLLIFTRRNDEFITGTFCSRRCGLNWIIFNKLKLKKFTADWENCEI